jgi:hypothetical protein
MSGINHKTPSVRRFLFLSVLTVSLGLKVNRKYGRFYPGGGGGVRNSKEKIWQCDF